MLMALLYSCNDVGEWQTSNETTGVFFIYILLSDYEYFNHIFIEYLKMHIQCISIFLFLKWIMSFLFRMLVPYISN